MDEQDKLRDALQLTKVPALFLIHNGTTVNSTSHVEVIRETLQTDLQPLLDAVRLQSGIATAEQLLVERINRAYEAAEKGLYETAIREYTDILPTCGPTYELTCLVALVKAHLAKLDTAHAEMYYHRIKTEYGGESRTVPAVKEVCEAVERNIAARKNDKNNQERYLALRDNLLSQSITDIPSLPLRLQLASLDFDFGHYTQAFDSVLSVIEEEQSLELLGYSAFREMCDVLGPENGYVKIARKRLDLLRNKLRI